VAARPVTWRYTVAGADHPFNLFRVSFHRPARSRHSWTRPSGFATLVPDNRKPERTFWAIVMDGKGLGLWNTMPIRSLVCVGGNVGP
jgi:hypothetical protein